MKLYDADERELDKNDSKINSEKYNNAKNVKVKKYEKKSNKRKPKDDNYEENYTKETKVVKVENNTETFKNAAKVVGILSATALASLIILATARGLGMDYEKKLIQKSYEEEQEQIYLNSLVVNTQQTDESEMKQTDESEMKQTDELQEDEFEEKFTKSESISPYEIDYSNVTTFYNHILENRNKYGSFAEDFQCEEDIENLINFIYEFDEMYSYSNITSSITSQEQFDKIISNYYKSCVNHDVKGELHLLFKNDSLAQKKFKEVEELAYNLKNGKGSDYTIANKYYTWFGVNLCDRRTAITRNMKNAPLIDALREHYEQYRYSGNMLNARKYQKNDSLPISSMEIYYKEVPEGVNVTETQNSFTCPDWGIDNVVSKYEENTETKLVKKEPGEDIFKQIDEAFDTVLNKGRTR